MRTGYLVGLLVGGAVLGGALVGIGALIGLLGWTGLTPVLVVCGVFLLLDILGLHYAFALNFRVPASWVGGHDFPAGLTWGVFLGLGFATESPYLALHAVLLTSAYLGSWQFVLAVTGLFLLGRALVLVKPVRRFFGHGDERLTDDEVGVVRARAQTIGQAVSRLHLLVLVGAAAVLSAV